MQIYSTNKWKSYRFEKIIKKISEIFTNQKIINNINYLESWLHMEFQKIKKINITRNLVQNQVQSCKCKSDSSHSPRVFLLFLPSELLASKNL